MEGTPVSDPVGSRSLSDHVHDVYCLNVHCTGFAYTNNIGANWRDDLTEMGWWESSVGWVCPAHYRQMKAYLDMLESFRKDGPNVR